MGNEVSHKRYCRKSAKFERQAAEQEKAEADLPVAPKALLWGSENLLAKEKSQDTAMGTQDKDTESATASSSPHHMQQRAAQIAVRATELQNVGETPPSAREPEETETKPAATTSPERPTCAPAQERAARAQPGAGGDTAAAKPDLPLQAAVEMAAGDAEDVISQTAAGRHSVVCKRPSGKLCKPSPLCRWLKKLKAPADKK